MKYWEVREPYLRLECDLGEAPYYEESSGTLRFVDIVKQKLHLVNPDIGPSSHQSHDLEDPVSTTADIDGNDQELIVGAKFGYAILNREDKKLKYLKELWDERDDPHKRHRMRLNDGAIDSKGRYWAGAMNDPLVTNPSKEGVLFRLDNDLTLHRVIEMALIPNGIGWSADDKTMYFTDSPTKNIFRFDYDATTGGVTNRRIFFHVDEPNGVPDGFAIDHERHLWVAVCGGGKVLRVSPDGELVGQISMPTRMISCAAFVGEDLFITSAMEEDPEKYPGSKTLGGSLFRIHVGVRGVDLHKFKMA